MSKDDLLETRRHLKTLHGGPDADPTGGMIDKCIRCSKGLRCEAHPRRHVPFWEPHHLVIKKPVQALPVKRSPPRVVPPTRRPFIPSQRKTHQSNHKERKRRKKRDVKPKPKVSRLLYDTKPFIDFDQPPEAKMTPVPGALFDYYHPPLPLAKVGSTAESKSQEGAEAKLEKKVDENGNESATVSKTAKEKVDPLDHTDGPLFEILFIEVTQCCREVDHNSNLAIEGGTKGPNPTKSVVCDECERRFASRVYLSTHIRLYHLGKPVMKRWKRRYRCLKCGESFTNVMRMRLHEDKKHAERFCVKCQRIFGTNSKFKEHVELVHREETNFKCVDCGLVFPQRQLLGRHRMSAHNGPRLFACPFKGCQHPPYRCSKALTAHIYTKHAHCKPFKCGQCGKKFVRDCDLKAHLEVHKVPVGVIPTFCKFCGAIFRQPRTCQKHEEECREINALNMATDCMSTTSVMKMEQKTTDEAGPSTSS